jgi:predicted SprT family Zn-dependent metalloprotease
MARPARQNSAKVEVEASDDELPELSTLLNGTARGDTEHGSRRKRTTASPLRRSSPRRRGTGAAEQKAEVGEPPSARGHGLELGRGISAISLTASTIALPPSLPPVKKSPVKGSPSKSCAKVDAAALKSPVKRSIIPISTTECESSAATSKQQHQRPLKLAHVNSLLLPLSQVSLGGDEESDREAEVEIISSSRKGEKVANAKLRRAGRSLLGLSPMEESESTARFDSRDVDDERVPRASPKRAAKEKANYLSRFVLKEARCNDDEEDSEIENDEDEEFTDLSGFIVDDDAELSFHGSDLDENGGFRSEEEKPNRKRQPQKRGLQRRRDMARSRMESEDEEIVADKENINVGDIAQDLFNLKLSAPTTSEGRRTNEIEIIDLTYSPPKPQPDPKPASRLAKERNARGRPSPTERSSLDTKSFPADENNQLLKFSPQRFKVQSKIPSDLSNTTITNPTSKPADSNPDTVAYTTPPTTPPASPTKLKSPSKLHLLSPSKRGATIPTSPHRQSIDAFWSSDVINTWNDQYSPRKLPLTASPKKRGLARLLDFDIWSDSEDYEVGESDRTRSGTSSSDPPTPTRCSPSPRKVPVSPSKLSSPSKKAVLEAKRAFESTRHTTAQALLTHLDTHITSGKLSHLSASTGGVQILWSKNLRSTAGRANWRRTVTRPSACSSTKHGQGEDVKPSIVQHYATIELAEKVIDSDPRLVNTLAHEFCHLANFMVSGVRDQPHGASFKAWADKVTTHLRSAPNLPQLYRTVEVTTKHSYAINHKYLWVCAGRQSAPPRGSAQEAARAFLALEEDDDPGCGTEYGRHSKSIDPERHRCGKCKGLLVQVRPQPKKIIRRAEREMGDESPRKGRRASPVKWRIGSDGGLGENEDRVGGGNNDKLDGLAKVLEYVNLSD